MRRVPVRARVTAAFALALIIVLAGTGLFLYLRFRADFDHALNQGLRSRAGDVAALVQQADTGLAQGGPSTLTSRGEAFAQVLEANGSIFDSTPLIRTVSLLHPLDIRRALSRSIFVDRGPIGRVGASRLFATPVNAQGRRLIVIVGASLAQRNAALDQLGGLLVWGGLITLLLVSGAGYAAVAAALRPIESMRRQAAEISAGDPGRRLPVPPAVDEVSRLGRTLNAMLVRLEDAFAHESQFVSDASHELRTPLGIVKTELELALRGDRTPTELREAIRSAGEENERVIQLAEDLLILARFNQGQLALRQADVDLSEALHALVRRFQPRATEQDRELNLDVAPDCRAFADPLRLERALGNMIENGLVHGEGPVTVSTVSTPAGVEIHVTDTGPGFSADFIDQAFERFTRADAGRGGAGAGLGLSLVRAIAVAHSGSAHAANREGGGADVWIVLPGERSAAHD